MIGTVTKVFKGIATLSACTCRPVSERCRSQSAEATLTKLPQPKLSDVDHAVEQDDLVALEDPTGRCSTR